MKKYLVTTAQNNKELRGYCHFLIETTIGKDRYTSHLEDARQWDSIEEMCKEINFFKDNMWDNNICELNTETGKRRYISGDRTRPFRPEPKMPEIL